jgi:hypothetical protein
VYFPRFSASMLADGVMQLEQSAALRKKLAGRGLKRSHDFSWRDHVDQIISLAHDLTRSNTGCPRAA